MENWDLINKMKRYNRVRIFLLFLALTIPYTLLPIPCLAAFSAKSAGTSGAAFLKLGAGARSTGLGEAVTGVADDVNAIYYNTAGLSTLKKNEFIGMRADLFKDLQYNFFAFAYPTKKVGTFAIGLTSLNVGEIEQRGYQDSDKPDSTFSSNDTAYTLAYGMKLSVMGLPNKEEDGGLHLGVGMKAIRQTLAGESANSVGFDLGSLYEFNSLPLSLGVSVQNMGTKVKFKNESDPLPLTIKVGASYRIGREWRISGNPSGAVGIDEEAPIKNGLLMAMDLNFPRDNDASVSGGIEFTRSWLEELGTSVRAGYETGRSRQISGTGSGVSAGAGFTFKFLTFDFAWMPFGDLGNTYRYSVRLRF